MPPKGRPKPSSPSPSPTSPLETLDRLKQALSTEGSIIKSPSHAKKHLENAGLIFPDQALTQTTYAEILLTLVVTAPTRKGPSDKIPERIANIIKAIALLLDTTSPPPTTSNPDSPPPPTTSPDPSLNPLHQQHHTSSDITRQLEDTVTFIKQASASHAETATRVNVLIERMEGLQVRTEKSVSDIETATRNQTTSTTTTPSPLTPSYRDTLVNGRHNPTAHTPTQHRLLNRLGIKACQILLDFEQDAHLKLSKSDSPEVTPTTLIKSTLNSWLNSPEDRKGPIPKGTSVRALQIFGNSRLLIEMNSPESAIWMRTNSERILCEILKCKTSILRRSFTVLARFVPVTFDISPVSLRNIENDLTLPTNSILNAIWIKDPTKRARDQKFANLKIFCATPETANTLITGPVYILNSRLCIQKEVKTPGVCNKCQKYGHIARDCKETNDTCSFCGQDHRSSLCNNSGTYKCTPCGSTEHPTNHTQCPVFTRLAQAILDKDPETASAFFITDETWTWGNQPGHADRNPSPPGAIPLKRGATLKNRKTNNPTRRPQPPPQQHQQQQHQRTLQERGFTIHTAAPRQNPPPPDSDPNPIPNPNPNPTPNTIPTRSETANPEAGGASIPTQ